MTEYDFTGQPQFEQNAGQEYGELMGGRNKLAMRSARGNLRSQGVGGNAFGAALGSAQEAQNRQQQDIATRYAQRQADLTEQQRRLVAQRQLQNEGIQKGVDYNQQMQDLTSKWRTQDYINATSGSMYGKVGGAVGTVAGGIIGGYLGEWNPETIALGSSVGGAAGQGIGGAVGEASGGTSLAGSYDPYGYNY